MQSLEEAQRASDGRPQLEKSGSVSSAGSLTIPRIRILLAPYMSPYVIPLQKVETWELLLVMLGKLFGSETFNNSNIKVTDVQGNTIIEDVWADLLEAGMTVIVDTISKKDGRRSWSPLPPQIRTVVKPQEVDTAEPGAQENRPGYTKDGKPMVSWRIPLPGIMPPEKIGNWALANEVLMEEKALDGGDIKKQRSGGDMLHRRSTSLTRSSSADRKGEKNETGPGIQQQQFQSDERGNNREKESIPPHQHKHVQKANVKVCKAVKGLGDWISQFTASHGSHHNSNQQAPEPVISSPFQFNNVPYSTSISAAGLNRGGSLRRMPSTVTTGGVSNNNNNHNFRKRSNTVPAPRDSVMNTTINRKPPPEENTKMALPHRRGVPSPPPIVVPPPSCEIKTTMIAYATTTKSGDKTLNNTTTTTKLSLKKSLSSAAAAATGSSKRQFTTSPKDKDKKKKPSKEEKKILEHQLYQQQLAQGAAGGSKLELKKPPPAFPLLPSSGVVIATATTPPGYLPPAVFEMVMVSKPASAPKPKVGPQPERHNNGMKNMNINPVSNPMNTSSTAALNHIQQSYRSPPASLPTAVPPPVPLLNLPLGVAGNSREMRTTSIGESRGVDEERGERLDGKMTGKHGRSGNGIAKEAVMSSGSAVSKSTSSPPGFGSRSRSAPKAASRKPAPAPAPAPAPTLARKESLEKKDKPLPKLPFKFSTFPAQTPLRSPILKNKTPTGLSLSTTPPVFSPNNTTPPYPSATKTSTSTSATMMIGGKIMPFKELDKRVSTAQQHRRTQTQGHPTITPSFYHKRNTSDESTKSKKGSPHHKSKTSNASSTSTTSSSSASVFSPTTTTQPPVTQTSDPATAITIGMTKVDAAVSQVRVKQVGRTAPYGSVNTSNLIGVSSVVVTGGVGGNGTDHTNHHHHHGVGMFKTMLKRSHSQNQGSSKVPFTDASGAVVPVMPILDIGSGGGRVVAVAVAGAGGRD